MIKVLTLVFLILLVFSPFFRCFLSSAHKVVFYTPYDIYHYFKDKKYAEYNEYGISIFVNMFGAGKTLSMTHKATQLYDRYGDKLRFISNYHLSNIPYIPLVSFKQLVDLGTIEDDDKIGTVVLIDEISTLLNNRNFSNFPIELLGLLLQQRKRKVKIYATAQRFYHVDKLLRSISNTVVSCRKTWRFVRLEYYDAWEYENAVNTQILKPLQVRWWFVNNRDFNAYDTSEMVSQASASDFISNEESIIRKGLDSSVVSPDYIPDRHKKFAFRRSHKK